MKKFSRRFRPRPLTRGRKIGYIAALTLPVLGLCLFGNRGLFRRLQLEMEFTRVHKEVYAERSAGDSLRAEITRLSNDTAAIERIARQRFGMVKPGETIYRIVE